MCKKNFFCRYALGAPIVGTTNVVYSLRSTLSKLVCQELFLITIPVTTTSTLPPQIQLCDGTVLNVVYSGSTAPADASALIGQRVYLATVLCVAGVPTVNILNAVNPAA